MVRHSTTTASLFSVLLAVLIVSLFLVGGAAAQTENTSLGTGALQNNTTGETNTAIGFNALFNNNVGDGNTASGDNALSSNTTGSGNTASGSSALSSNTTANGNTASGLQALWSNTTGEFNTASGAFALFSNTTGTLNTAIGANAEVAAGDLTNATAIGHGAIVDASNKIRLGNDAVTVIEGQVALTFVSDKNKKENFQPVNGEAVLEKIRGLALSSWNFTGHDPQAFRHYGPMAQDFFAAFGHDGVGQIGSETTINSGDLAGILMSAVQALEKRTTELNETVAAQAQELAALKAQNARLRAAVRQQQEREAALAARLERLEAAAARVGVLASR
jgi:uncharacterized coiled-coil protein SlyX